VSNCFREGLLKKKNALMATESYYLGVDDGGSKTLAVIVDAQGRECGRGGAGSANYAAVGLEKALHTIHVAIAQATSDVSCSLPLVKAWSRLAGIDHPVGKPVCRQNKMQRSVNT